MKRLHVEKNRVLGHFQRSAITRVGHKAGSLKKAWQTVKFLKVCLDNLVDFGFDEDTGNFTSPKMGNINLYHSSAVDTYTAVLANTSDVWGD